MKKEHHATVGRFGDVRVRAVCSCGSALVARCAEGKVVQFTLIGASLCPALALVKKRLRPGS